MKAVTLPADGIYVPDLAVINRLISYRVFPKEPPGALFGKLTIFQTTFGEK